MNVTVTNNGTEAFTGRFDGREYVFAPGDPVTITDHTAAFLFNYGMPDDLRNRMLIRNGWLKNSIPTDPHGPQGALKRLYEFAFAGAAEAPKKYVREAIMLKAPRVASATGNVSREEVLRTQQAADAWAAAEGLPSTLVTEEESTERIATSQDRVTHAAAIPGRVAPLAPHSSPA